MLQTGWEKSRISNYCYAKVINALVREWIMLEKGSPHFPIPDDLEVQGGLETWEN